MTLTSTSSLEETLNAYIADEYFASLQYRMAKVVAKGKALGYSNNIFGDNGDEEDEHFDEIVEYAQSLNIPVQVNPKEMETNCTTPFVELHDGDTTAQLVTILIAAEKKAIEGYEIGLRNDAIIKDHPELTQFLGEKLNDERGHLKELEDLESNISAEGKTVPQSDIEDENVEDENENEDDVEDNGKESNDDSDDDSENTNESVDDSGEKYDEMNELMRRINLKDISINDVVKSVVTYLPEDKISNFVDYQNVFSSEIARNSSQYSNECCKHKLVEMIDDGMADSNEILEKLFEFVGNKEIREIVSTLGLIEDDDKVGNAKEISGFKGLGESAISFSKIFKQVING